MSALPHAAPDLESIKEGCQGSETAKLLIGGQWREARERGWFKRTNPLDPNIFTVAAAAQADDATMAAEAAAQAFPAWRATGPTRRRALLLQAAALLEGRGADFASSMARETGASRLWADRNVTAAAATLREAAAMTTQVSGEIIPSDVPGNLALAVRQPAGVVLGIAPWNAPVVLAVRAVAMPLACGNTVVLKGSEVCPRTHALVAETLQEAGLPAGVVNFITHSAGDAAAVVEAMIAHPAVRRVNFTGSTRTGRLIAQTCAKYLKPVLLELGGKAPFIVLDDADIDAAVAAATFGAFDNSGQVCMSTERLIVDESVADEFVGKLVVRAQGLTIGDALTGSFVLGSLADSSMIERCNALIADALAKGARLLCGGRASSTLMPATLLDHVSAEMMIYREETFAPVKPIVRVRGVEQAIATANDNELGLSAAVFGRDLARAWQVATRIESGICHVNGPSVHGEPQMPFGGVKASGYGRFGGKWGIDAFTEVRWITLQTTSRQYPF